MIGKLVKLAILNLWRHRRRHIISMTMIGISLAGLVLVAGHRYRHDRLFATNGTYQARRGHIVISKKDGLDFYSANPAKYGLRHTDIKVIEEQAAADQEIDFFGRYREETGLLSNGCSSIPVIVTGVDMSIEGKVIGHEDVKQWLPALYHRNQDRNLTMFTDLGAPIAVTPSILDAMRKPLYSKKQIDDLSMVVDCSSSQQYNDAFVQIILKDEYEDLFPIDGYLTSVEEASNNFLAEFAIQVPIESLKNRDESFSYVALYLKDIKLVDQVLQRWQKKEALAGYQILPSNGEAVNPVYTSLLSWLWSVEYFVYSLMSLVLMITISNFLVMSIHERRSEISTYLALGFTKSFMVQLLALETFFLTLFSAIFGALAATITIVIVNSMNIPYLPPGASIDVSFKLAASPFIYLTRSAAVVFLALATSLVVTNFHCRYDRMVAGLAARG